MGYYLGNALLSTIEGEALLALDVAAARALFVPPADVALDCCFGGPLDTWARRPSDVAPEPDRFGATMIHAPSFGVGSWRYAPDPGLVPGAASVEVQALSRLAADHRALKLCAPHFSNQVFLFAEGLRRRQAFYLAFEAGIRAGDPSVYQADDRSAFSILLNRADVDEASLREAAALRAQTLGDDARIALNALLIQARRRIERRARGRGLFAWTSLASSLDFTRPEELAGARVWLLDVPCVFSGEIERAPKSVEGPHVTVAFDSSDRFPPHSADLSPLDARLEHLEAEARAGTPRARRLVAIELLSLGLFGAEAHPLREHLRARGLTVLASYADAAGELARYYASEERAAFLSTPAPAPLSAGKVSLEWFRRPWSPPPGHSRFSWTAIAERAVPDGAQPSELIILRESGRSYRLHLDAESAIAAADPI